MFEPKATQAETNQNVITAMSMLDEEGEIKTVDISAKVSPLKSFLFSLLLSRLLV